MLDGFPREIYLLGFNIIHDFRRENLGIGIPDTPLESAVTPAIGGAARYFRQVAAHGFVEAVVGNHFVTHGDGADGMVPSEAVWT